MWYSFSLVETLWNVATILMDGEAAWDTLSSESSGFSAFQATRWIGQKWKAKTFSRTFSIQEKRTP
jgi:hypothetical protein